MPAKPSDSQPSRFPVSRRQAAARNDPSVDWIIVQMHQCACSSSATGNGSDLGTRQQWLPLFDQYEVDLVLNGHDHDYERSFPVRGADANVGREVATGAVVNTLRPRLRIVRMANVLRASTMEGMVRIWPSSSCS
jgi:3',5'-cyclic AMP phosphodiesterase CpdA